MLWEPVAYASDGIAGVRFTYKSHDGEEGYPGNLLVTADYSLNAANELKMEFSATTDAPTPINLCNHAYWNLTGDFKADIKEHVRCCEHFEQFYESASF